MEKTCEITWKILLQYRMYFLDSSSSSEVNVPRTGSLQPFFAGLSHSYVEFLVEYHSVYLYYPVLIQRAIKKCTS